MLSNNSLLRKNQISLINLWAAVPISEACNKCGDESFKEALTDLQAELTAAQNNLRSAITFMPILSLQNPMGWSYEPISIVSAQTVTGTGLFSDVTSALTDLFGTQSGAYNVKLREGEDICKASLKAQAIEMGGSAVLAVDIDYAEVGGSRAMLMVCMTGTVVKVSECPAPLCDNLPQLAEAYKTSVRARQLQEAINQSHLYY
jgi:uncharacterized protein YbjQ (UPF0145 family)